MDKHLMYISFPKFENNGEDEHLSANYRFFKKILYKYTQELYEYNLDDFDVLEDQEAVRGYRENNPQSGVDE